MNEQQQADFIDLVAQAVVDKLEERERVNRLADLIVQRVLAMQTDEGGSSEGEDNGRG